ncbi:hypothetical protein RJ639_006344, partial [Escallonia herrerae]
WNSGNWQIQKQKTGPNLSSEFSSCSRGTFEDDLGMFEPGRRSSKRVTGTPIKKLLAEEMSKEIDTKKRSPSVVARLMGLDGMPTQQPVPRQLKSLPNNYEQGTTSIELQKNGQPKKGWSSRKSSMEQQEFKDVYEDLEASHVANRRYSSQRAADLKLIEPEMAFIHKQFMDAKHIPSDEKVHGSKDFSDKFEMLDSNKNLMLKFFQEPDSLFVKHLRDLRTSSSSSICNRIAILKPSDSAKYESNARGWKSEREASRKHGIDPLKNLEDGITRQSNIGRAAHNSPKSSTMRIAGKDERDTLPTRIVVLKPSLEKTSNATKYVSSPNSSHYRHSDRLKQTEYSVDMAGETESWRKNHLPNDTGFSRPKSREAREIAKKITREMRETFGSESLPYSGIRGYAGDESSCNMSASDSASESEVLGLTPRNCFERKHRHKLSISGSTESSVSREAKKRLSERWKMAHRYQDAGVFVKGSTLGEMLAIPDTVARSKNLDGMMDLDGSSDSFASNSGNAVWDSPLGISSREGWNDGSIRHSARSRSLPPLSFRSYETSAQSEALVADRLLMPKEATSRVRSKAGKGRFHQKEDLSPKILRSSNKKPQTPRHRYTCSTDSFPEINSSQNEEEINLEKHPFESQPMVSQTLTSGTSTVSVVDAVVDTAHESIAMSSESSDELPPILSTCILGNDDSASHDQDDSNSQEPPLGSFKGSSVPLQCPGLEPETSESSKEADHPSPVSVLEVRSTEDVSSGLRMQLQLLKMESEAYALMLISNDDDIGQGSVIFSEENEVVGSESWKSSYLVDVLIDSGFEDTDPDKFMTIWPSPDRPLAPWVFDNLEKKYCDETTGLRSERRLVFDRINSAMLEIFQRLLDSYVQSRPTTMGFRSKWAKCRIKDELHKLLARQVEEANDDMSETVLDREMEWLDSGDGVRVIGKEIEKLLIDDLLIEAVTM